MATGSVAEEHDRYGIQEDRELVECQKVEWVRTRSCYDWIGLPAVTPTQQVKIGQKNGKGN